MSNELFGKPWHVLGYGGEAIDELIPKTFTLQKLDRARFRFDRLSHGNWRSGRYLTGLLQGDNIAFLKGEIEADDHLHLVFIHMLTTGNVPQLRGAVFSLDEETSGRLVPGAVQGPSDLWWGGRRGGSARMANVTMHNTGYWHAEH